MVLHPRLYIIHLIPSLCVLLVFKRSRARSRFAASVKITCCLLEECAACAGKTSDYTSFTLRDRGWNSRLLLKLTAETATSAEKLTSPTSRFCSLTRGGAKEACNLVKT
eukprot:757427-Hanusia_phi.AAC.1